MIKQKCNDKTICFKALSDNNRIEIIKMLAQGEMCACKILEKFKITQPTLSHHMKVLIDCEFVSSRKEGNWIKYSLNKKGFDEIKKFITNITE